MVKKSKGPKKQPTGDYPTGYCRPPVHSRTKPGQVLNPHGHNGQKAWEPDAFEKARRRPSRVTIEGEVTMLPSDEAYWLRTMAAALAGDKTASRIVAQEYAARRRLGPAPPTAEELQQQAQEEAERERLSGIIVDALEELAEIKRESGPPRMRYGPDGRPIGTYDAAPPTSPGPFDKPVE